MSSGEDDKTVFGGKLPTPKSSDSPFDAAASTPPPAPMPRRPAPGADDKTVIGGVLPPAPGQPGGFRPSPPPPAATPAGSGQTWLGGPVSPQHGIGQAPAQQDGFFPDIPQGVQPNVSQPNQPRIPLDQALRAAGLGQGASSNPLIAAASNLLILFGRLRTGMVEMNAIPLMEHVTREIEQFEHSAVQAGVDPHEAQVAKYALSGTADDIVQNLPGADRGVWIQYSMVARFFHKRDSGVGFFQEAEKAMHAPAQRYNLLELMLVCLSLGFEGQYRTLPYGGVELGRIRTAIYESLRRINPRPDDDVSVNWQPVEIGRRRRFGSISIWAMASIAALLVAVVFGTLSTLISRDGAVVEANLLSLHPNDAPLSIERSGLDSDLEVYVAENSLTQLERISEALAPEIQAGQVQVGLIGDYVYIRVGNLLLFESGSSTVRDDFALLAARISETLNTEAGPVRVVGHTDSIPLSGRGPIKTNLDLSVARADAVSTVLAGQMIDPARLAVEGRGAADPIADNATREGRASNRRVEVLLAREGTF